MTLRKGQVYSLTLESGSKLNGTLIAKIWNDEAGLFGLPNRHVLWACPYDSYSAFRRNWEPIN